MPGMTGTQLSRAIATLAPGLPVILVSGYGGMLLAQRARHAGIVQILAKPLRRQDLALALSDVLA
jgi:FixJ family two-component response regulator